MKIYHWFVPNKKNKFHPLALRSTGLIIFLAIFLAIPIIYNLTTTSQFRVLGYATNVTINDLYSLSNQERTNNGLAPLSLNTTLDNAALAKANDMMTDDYWAHIAPDGTTPWFFITNAGYSYSVAGENLAKGFNTSSGVVAGWMASQTHRDNVLNSSYQDVGYAVVNGTLSGSETTLVVAMYGLQSEPVVAAAAPIETPVETQPQQTAAPAQVAVANTTPVAVAEPAPITTEESAPVTAQPETTTTTKTDTTTTDATTKQDQGVQAEVAKTTDNKDGIVEGIASSLPIRTYNSLNWGQKTSILLISTLILLFAMKHTLIWREQKRGLRHIWLRAHPIGQIAILTTVLIVTLISGTGVIL